MVEPYTDDSSTRGEMTIGERQLERIKQAHSDGIQVRMHSTADGTTRKLLDVIEEARAKDPKPELRHQIGHLMLVTKEDIPRFKELNVIAEFSPALWYPTELGSRMDPKANSGDKLGEGIDLETGLKILTINGAMAVMHDMRI